jgi:glycosyltransferase involved in cell wall biosynthesis
MARVLHVLPPGHPGGAERMALSLAAAHRARGLDTALLTFAEGDVSRLARELGLPVILSELNPALPMRAAVAIAIRDTVRKDKPALVHSHVPLTHLICNRELPPLGVPWIATVHGSWKQFAYAPQTVQQPWRKPYLLLRHAAGDYWSLRQAARVVAISDYVRRQLAAVGVRGPRVVTVHNGLAVAAAPLLPAEGRARLGIDPQAFVIGSLGYFAPVKGFDVLIRAFGLLAPRYPELSLLIAGGDVMGESAVRQSLERLMTELKITARARLIGPLDPRAGFLSALDIFVVSSRTEGFSLALADAMQHGKPSVVTSEGGCTEVAQPNIEGLVFHSGSPASLAQELEKLITDPALRTRYGQAARERATTYLTLDRCAAEYTQVYRSITPGI